MQALQINAGSSIAGNEKTVGIVLIAVQVTFTAAYVLFGYLGLQRFKVLAGTGDTHSLMRA